MGGNSGKDQTRAAEAAERARTQQIAQAQTAINAAFSGRQSQYDDFVNALRGEFTADATKQKGIADRQLKFSNARAGLTGGSQAADSGTQLGEEFQKGLLTAERKAQSSLADLVSADEASRSQLFSLAQGGASVGAAASQTANALRANIAGAKDKGTVEGLGDIFGNTYDLYTKQQEAAARRRGLKESEVYSDPFSK